MHQGWPKFVETMWMATNDNGLAAVSYGPSVVTAKVAKGKEVTITEETNYPFNGLITFTISTEKPVKFPLEFRIPGWADSVERSTMTILDIKEASTGRYPRKVHGTMGL
jgi:DUF1680 family protein